MAVAKLYTNVFAHLAAGRINYLNDTIKVALLSSAYTPNQDDHLYFSDVVANEVTGTNYVAGGVTLSGKTVTVDKPTNVTILDAEDPTWATSTITARYAVIYDATPGTNATRPLIGFVDFGTDQSSQAGNFVGTLDPTGLVRLTAAA